MPLTGIQPAETLGIRVLENHIDRVILEMPLEGNLNDKNTMFAGSQFSAMVLAGWSLATNWAKDMGVHAPVVIHKTEMEFSRPVVSDLICKAVLAEVGSRSRSGNYQLKIRIEATDAENEICAVLQGDYRVLAGQA